MRAGSASANGSRQTCTWYRTEVITAAPPAPRPDGIVLRLTPLRSATVPRIAIIIIITTTTAWRSAIPASASTTAEPACWPRTALFSALLVLTALRGVDNAGISPAAKIIL